MAIYAKFEGINGSATDENHSGWCELEDVSFDTTRRVKNKVGSGQSRDIAMPTIGAIEITKVADKSSPYLLQQMLKGEAISQVQINLCQTGNTGSQPYAKYILNDVLVSQFKEKTSSIGNVGQEYLVLNFTKIQKTFIPFDASGNPGSPITVGYDLETAKAS